MASYQKVPEHNRDGSGMVEGRGESNPEKGIQILPKGKINLAASEEEERHTTSGGDEERRVDGALVGVSRKPLVRTPGNVGHIRETEGEVLVAGDVS